MLKILLVDDSLARTELIKNTLDSLDDSKHLKFVSCDSADSARELLTDEFDLLILDILIPKKSKSTPQSLHSVNLLSDINNPRKPYIRPRLTIGLTADIAELKTYKASFLEHASIVLDGQVNSQDWIENLKIQITSLLATQQKKSQVHTDKILVSIHGIRTYGQWQYNLSKEMKKYSRNLESYEVKYGFFDILSFSVPWLRNRKIKQISARVESILAGNADKKIFLVAHSFGTLIVSNALRGAPKDSIEVVLLCGSPISHGQDIDHIISASKMTVNECGNRDFILVLARILIMGLGDAGRIGFSRENSSKFMNRFFSGGHSLYFRNYDAQYSFYEKFWLPILTTNERPEHFDSRKNYFGEDIVDIAIKALTILKPIFNASLVAFLAYLLTTSV